MALSLVHNMQNHYPERLGLLVVMDTPWIFSSFYSLISPLLSKQTASKIVFASGKQKIDVLLNHIEKVKYIIGNARGTQIIRSIYDINTEQFFRFSACYQEVIQK